MQHNPVTIPAVPESAFLTVDASQYDNQYIFRNDSNSLALEVAHVSTGNKHIPAFNFLPWGWGLSVPTLRKYNVYAQKHYFGEIYHYSLRHIRFTKPSANVPVLEQLARRWLEAHIEQGIIQTGKPILVMGCSMGGAIASAIAAVASEYNVVLGNLNMYEPAGLTAKKPLTMLRQVSDDTKEDFIESFGSRGAIQLAKADIFLRALRNGPFQARCVLEISQGNLSAYINKYLQTQKGEVHIGHGAESTFVTFDDLDKFSEQLVDPSRVMSYDFAGYKHGLGLGALELADWFSAHMAKHQ